MNHITSKTRLAYAAEDANRDAANCVDLAIERAERMVADLKKRRDQLADPKFASTADEVLGYALNEVQNFTRNIDPDRWMRAASKLAVVNALHELGDILPESNA